MVREDIVRGLNVLYKMCKKEERTVEELEMNIYVWEEIFKPYSYEQFKLAIMQFLANDVYKTFPAVGAVYKYIAMANKTKHREFTEVWQEIYKAICNSGYHANESFDSLSIEAKEVVRSPQNLKQWAMTEDFNAEVVYSNLNQIYKNNCKHKDQVESIPENLRIGVGFEQDRIFIEKKDHYSISDSFDEEPINRTTDFSQINNMIYDLKRKMCN
jgi:hypothetical protein